MAWGFSNTGGGGLKSTDAILLVTVPTGSSVTATKSGLTLTPKLWTQSADNTLDTAIFSIPSRTFDANAWTVTATLNGETATDTIVINSAKAYEVVLDYTFYCFKDGDQCTSRTGGWTTQGFVIESGYASTAPTVSYSGTTVTVSLSSGKKSGFYYTVNDIDLSRFSTAYFNITAVSGQVSNGYCSVGIINRSSNSVVSETKIYSTGQKTVDLTNINANYAVGIIMWVYNSSVSVTADIIYLA